MACHHARAITHTALDLTKQEVQVSITEAQPEGSTPHLYGMVFNQGIPEKVRVFPGPSGHADSTIRQLTQLDSKDLAASGLVLIVAISFLRNEKTCQWSGAAIPFDEQAPKDQAITHRLLNQHALQVAAEEPRSPRDVVSDGKITASNQPDQITAFFQQGDNPGLLLTKSTARLQGKTDQGLMVILRVAAELKGVQVSDLINEVMWDAVRSGKLWDCQPDNGMP